MPGYIERHGLDAAVEISNHEVAHLQVIKQLVEKEHIDCDFTLTRTFDVFLDEGFANKSKEAYDAMVARGLTCIQDAHFTPAKYAERVSGVKDAKGCFSFTAAHLWPYKFILHLLGFAVAKGLNLQTHTLVTHVTSTADGHGYHTVTTPRGSIKARKIVFASNGFTAGLLPEYSRKIVPCRGICCRIVTPDLNKAPYLNTTYSLRTDPGMYDYLIPRVDGSIIVGGAKAAMSKDKSVWYDNIDDNELIEPAKEYFDGYMQRSFVGWEESGAYVDDIWTGSKSPNSNSYVSIINVLTCKKNKTKTKQFSPLPSTNFSLPLRGYPSDHLPHRGPIPNRPSQHILAGFNGHGMPVIFLAAKAVAEMVLDEKSFEETGLPRLYRTSEERLR